MWVIDVKEIRGSYQFRRNLFGGLLRIGRDRDCDIQLASASVSRQHAQIEVRDGKLFFRDLESFNGSTVNGRKARGEMPVSLRSVIEIGGFRLTIEPDPEKDTPARFTMHPDDEPATLPMDAVDLPSEWTAASALLAKQIRGIRSHRDGSRQQLDSERVHCDQEWTRMLTAARHLESELHGHPKVQHYTFSKDSEQLTVKIVDPGKNGGFAYFILSRRDPDTQHPHPHGLIALREFGERDCYYREPKDALNELVKRLATRLA